MSKFSPRLTLPDTWAENSHCPICGMIPLWVLHQQSSPDEMNCPRCGAAFQVDTAGRHLFLTQTPPGYLAPIGERWLPAKDIHSYTKQHPWSANPPTPAQTEPESIPDIVADELPHVSIELVAKARELIELGNSRYKIRMILMDTEKLSDEEIDHILQVAFQDADKKDQRQNRTLLIVGGILVVLCVCSIITMGAIRKRSASTSTVIDNMDSPSAQQAPKEEEQEGINLPFLPDSVEQLMPLLSGEPPNFPAPQILPGSPTGNQVYTCPLNADSAADIFGGSASSWTMTPSPMSWAYFSLVPTTLYIPNGLTGEILYLNESGGGTRSAPGPATIQDATMILIMCE